MSVRAGLECGLPSLPVSSIPGNLGLPDKAICTLQDQMRQNCIKAIVERVAGTKSDGGNPQTKNLSWTESKGK